MSGGERVLKGKCHLPMPGSGQTQPQPRGVLLQEQAPPCTVPRPSSKGSL